MLSWPKTCSLTLCLVKGILVSCPAPVLVGRCAPEEQSTVGMGTSLRGSLSMLFPPAGMLLVVELPARLPNSWPVEGIAALVVRLVFWLPLGVTKMILMMLLLSILLLPI